MKTIRILRPEDVVIHRPMVPTIDPKEAEKTLRMAIKATERLRRFVEIRQWGLFSEIENEPTKDFHGGNLT